jgi:hypothetical protein
MSGEAQQSLEELAGVFRKWLHLPNLDVLYVTLATIAANRIPGVPVWLMLIGPSSGGKTETLLSVADLPDIYVVGTLSGEAALLSGSSKKDCSPDATGGLLPQVGKFGIIVCKDFTSILSMRRDKRAEILAALREIYDGSWTRPLGVDGGRTLEWKGKLGLMAGCTGVIDSHHAVIAAMGERFVFFRLPKLDATRQAEEALKHADQDSTMRRELRRAVAGFFEGLGSLPKRHPQLTEPERHRLIALAELAVRCRSAVERDSFTREVQSVPDAELPARLVKVLAQLLAGLKLIGVNRARAWHIIVKVALDSMPAIRRKVFNKLRGTESATIESLGLQCPDVTVRRALEDLRAHGVVDRSGAGHQKSDRWSLSLWARRQYETATGSFSEMSGKNGRFRNVG